MGKTIRNLSDELQISKQAIYKRMAAIDNFGEKYTTKIGNRIVVDADGEKKIKNFSKIHHSRKAKYQRDITKLLKDQLDAKDEQIIFKDFELEAKDDRISDLLEILKRQQYLYHDALNEIKNLKYKINNKSQE
jgi:hypothetical protein